jgi:RNA polymerase sigma factor (sigma-70 family)
MTPATLDSPEDFAAYVQSRRAAIAGVFRRFGLPPEVGDDILQDTCVLYLEKAGTINPRAARAWFFAVLRQRCLMHFRGRRALGSIEEALLPPTRPAQLDWERRHDLARALAQIAPKHRAVLLDQFVYGFRGAELAQRHSYAEGSVSNVRTRALGRLLKILTMSPPPPSGARPDAVPRSSASIAKPAFDPASRGRVNFKRMKKRGRGRPKSRPPELSAFTALMTPQAKARLKALARVKGAYAYSVLEASFWQTWKQLPAAERRKAEALAQSLEAPVGEEAGSE